MNTPKKLGYKYTEEFGYIPEDWELKQLGNIANIQRGASPRPIDSPIWFDKNSFIGWTRISDVNGKYLTKTEQKLSELGIKNSRYVPTNNLIMSICATLGRPAIVKTNICIHDGFVCFYNLKINIEYMYYYLQYIQDDWKNNGQTGSQANLNTDLINSTLISVSKHKLEQQKIAEVLSDVDSFIEKTQQLINKKKDLKIAVMQELLKPKDDWEEKTLEELNIDMLKGNGLAKGELCDSGKYYCIHYGELFGYYKEFITKIRHKTDKMTIPSKINDVLMPTSDVTPTGLAKASCIKIENVSLGGDILILRCKNNIDGVFLSYLIRKDKNQILQLVSGTTVYHIYPNDMKKFRISYPKSIDTQKKIVEVLQDIDSEIEALEKELNKYKDLKTGMMQQLLTGKVRLM